MIRTGFHNGSYVILSIAREAEDICTYIVRDRSGKQYIACEIRSLALIDRWLPEISAAADSGRLVCFTENAYLYIVTSYTDGENAQLFFSVQHTELRRKLEMLRGMTFRLVDCSDMPEPVIKGLLTRQSACVLHGEIALNCFIDPREERSPFQLYSELFTGCFSPAEIKRVKYLGIITQKLSNGIYKSFMEIYLDLGQLLDNLSQPRNIISRAKKVHERSKGLVRILLSAAVLVAAAVVVYNIINRSSQESVGTAYTPIDHIGTVSIGGESETAIRDIHVSAPESE